MRALLALPLLALSLTACGSKAKGPKGPTFAAGAEVRITDAGQIFDALNTTTCIKWPSDDVKKRAGRDGWKGFDPDAGLLGKVVAAVAHCDGRTQVVLIEIGSYVVPVTSKGVETVAGDKEGKLAARSAGPVAIGEYARIIDDGPLYDTLNATECVKFPSEDAKERGGVSGWYGYYPYVGQEGVVLGYGEHCDTGLQIAFLDMGEYVVPIGVAGIEPASGGMGYGEEGGVEGGIETWESYDPYGGYGGYGYGGVVGGVVGGSYAIGDSVEIVNNGEVYSGINTTDCLAWPSQDLKDRGGDDEWTKTSYYPANGEVGMVLGSATHCDSGIEVLFLDVDGHIVPIKAEAVTYYCVDC